MEGSMQRLCLIQKGHRQQRRALRNTRTHSNQSLLFLIAVKAFMLTWRCDQSFIHAFKRDWPVIEHVCKPAPDNTPYPCQHTIALFLILPVLLCVTLPTMHCVFVYMHANRDLYIFQAISYFWLRCKHPFIQPIRGYHFIPMETCLGSNWQIDLHDFDYIFFFFCGLVFKFVYMSEDLSDIQWDCVVCFCYFIPFFFKSVCHLHDIFVFVKWENRAS